MSKKTIKLIFCGGSSGTIQHFPYVGDWKSEEIKELNKNIADELVKNFSCIKYYNKKEKKLVKKKDKILFLPKESMSKLNRKGGEI